MCRQLICPHDRRNEEVLGNPDHQNLLPFFSHKPASSGLPANEEMPGVTFMFPPGSARTSGRPPTVSPSSQENTCTLVPVEPPSKMTAKRRPVRL
mmetsp:Transcript_71732/g.142234  ORF Transcript_71732/g.142234 Transcript_71732/m.142234 type:complete len:95 (-) Transcript_71732:73-357(-)